MCFIFQVWDLMVWLLRGDYQSRMNGYAIGRQNGWISANDIRELENLDRIPEEEGGDLYLINGNMTKLKDAGIFAGKESEPNEEVLEVEISRSGSILLAEIVWRQPRFTTCSVSMKVKSQSRLTELRHPLLRSLLWLVIRC